MERHKAGVCLSGVSGRNLRKIASVRLSDGTLEVNLVEFTRTETGDKWVKRVVGYIPDGKQYPTQRMFLDPPRDWKPEEEEEAATAKTESCEDTVSGFS